MSNSKLFNTIDLLNKIAEEKSNNKTIGFTNGCFDLLHKGHFFLLHEAKKKCDFLVVGLNSDSSIKSLKGPKRPVENQILRSNKLSEIEDVNAISIFDSLTPEEMIKKIKPDILIKGNDYRREEIVGSKYVIENGGSVELVELLPGFSTTKIIQENLK